MCEMHGHNMLLVIHVKLAKNLTALNLNRKTKDDSYPYHCYHPWNSDYDQIFLYQESIQIFHME